MFQEAFRADANADLVDAEQQKLLAALKTENKEAVQVVVNGWNELASKKDVNHIPTLCTLFKRLLKRQPDLYLKHMDRVSSFGRFTGIPKAKPSHHIFYKELAKKVIPLTAIKQGVSKVAIATGAKAIVLLRGLMDIHDFRFLISVLAFIKEFCKYSDVTHMDMEGMSRIIAADFLEISDDFMKVATQHPSRLRGAIYALTALLCGIIQLDWSALNAEYNAGRAMNVK